MGVAQFATRCPRCGRVLTSKRSLAAGVGRTCKAKIAAAAKTVTAKPAQVAKAVDLVEVGGIVPLRRRHSGQPVCRTVSSRGDCSYLTSAHNCTCPAGLKSRDCYHTLAVQLIAA